MAANPLYDAWKSWLEQRFPRERLTRICAVAAAAMGIFQSRSVHLGQIAAEVPGRAKVVSQERRLERLVNNRAICPKRWYSPLARWPAGPLVAQLAWAHRG